jgi:hypothetical protein
MDDGKYNDWFGKEYDDNVIAFIEKFDDEFEEFCQNRYMNNEPDPDAQYDAWKEAQYEKNNGEL